MVRIDQDAFYLAEDRHVVSSSRKDKDRNLHVCITVLVL
jgi:hypothetical protein